MRTIHTGVRANAEHIAQARVWAAEARSMPVMISGGARLPERTWADDAHETFMRRIDELAQRYGLPPPDVIDGEVWHYGMAADGEFTRAEPAP